MPSVASEPVIASYRPEPGRSRPPAGNNPPPAESFDTLLDADAAATPATPLPDQPERPAPGADAPAAGDARNITITVTGPVDPVAVTPVAPSVLPVLDPTVAPAVPAQPDIIAALLPPAPAVGEGDKPAPAKDQPAKDQAADKAAPTVSADIVPQPDGNLPQPIPAVVATAVVVPPPVTPAAPNATPDPDTLAAIADTTAPAAAPKLAAVPDKIAPQAAGDDGDPADPVAPAGPEGVANAQAGAAPKPTKAVAPTELAATAPKVAPVASRAGDDSDKDAPKAPVVTASADARPPIAPANDNSSQPRGEGSRARPAPDATATPPSHAAAARQHDFLAAPAANAPASTTLAQDPGIVPAAALAAASGIAPHTAAPHMLVADASSAGVPLSGLPVEIANRARDGSGRFEIRLDPPELGRIDVHLKVDRDGNVTSHLIVERSETLDFLRRDAPALERALQSAGLKTDESGMQFSLRDQALRDHGGRDPATTNRLIVPDEELPPAQAQRGYGRLLGLGAGIDIRV